MALFDAFVARGELQDTLPERVAFAGSAQDCLAKGQRPGAMLRHRVKQGLLNWCTNAGESAVYTAIKRHLGLLEPLESPPVPRRAVAAPKLELTPDAAVLFAQRRAPRSWSPERAQQAQLELANGELKRRQAQHQASQERGVGGLSLAGFSLGGLAPSPGGA